MTADTDPSPHAFATDEERFDAIARRDPAADGAFVYSVASTGVYCRPQCASRPARRENVAFHGDADAAERAGFRACKRCRPRDPSSHARTDALVAVARKSIERAERTPTLDDLAREAGMSPFHFQRVFKAATGLSPSTYARAVRATRARERLAEGASVTHALYDAGYAASSRFYDDARAFAMTPRDVRAGAAGIDIAVTIVATSLGKMLVAATTRGVCAVLFGDDETALRADLARRFPRARSVAVSTAFEVWTRAITAYLEHPRGTVEVPLDVLGTAFQQRVWRELRAIEPGETATYTAVAERLGAPHAARAVANACAANPAAIAIPCHRVVRRDGSLGGYRWGVARKAELLARESRD